MKKNILLSLFLCLSALISSAQQVTITPATFSVTDEITITVSFASAVCNTMGTTPAKVYMHAGIGNDSNAFGFAVVGNWGVDDSVGYMTNNGNGTWSKTLVPSVYFGLNASQQAGASKLGMVFRNANGTQTLKKATACTDFIYNVGYFQMSQTAPGLNSTTMLNSGESLNVQANNTNGPANYVLRANGVVLSTATAVTSFNFTHANITSNQNYELEATQGTAIQNRKFSVIINPGTITQSLPSSSLVDGINYDPSDATKATLVLDAPFKDFIYVAGSFNNWNPDNGYAMKKDAATGKFWLELTGLTAGQVYSYQYWVCDNTDVPANSPKIVKTADPYSTLVLSPYDDPGIPASNYPNLPAYPVGQEREVTVLQTAQTPYNWQVTNFVKPEKDNLVVYEVLVRDFDSHRSYQDLIDKVDYFKNLKVNAIELMPVMEYEGNESWGYNTAFHLANDKFYGPSSKLKELIDVYHQNGIAVILDVALNHAFGRNPMNRMWMTDPDGDGFGAPSAENPYFNVTATHSYSVGSDFNHQQPRTQNYVKRVVKHWIEEYHIDGFRWDLTKGFTQNCATGGDACTNTYQQDRVDILKTYASYSWDLDPTHYTIFEHLGNDNEEQQWANFRINETPSKGVMMWGILNNQYSQLAMGYNSSADITRMGHKARGYVGKRVIGYAESHDEERLMYKNLQFGNSTNPAHNVKTLDVALSRMSAIGAASLLVPGPKMIWHFGDLGWESSIFTCNNGSVNTSSDAILGDCKLDTKPQPQWSQNWLADVRRNKIYNDWARMISLKETEPVFNGDYTINSGSTNLAPRLYVYDTALIGTQSISNVVVLTNFNVTEQNIVPDFPTTGVWYDLMDNSPITVTSTNAPISIPAGGFRVFGNKATVLGANEFASKTALRLSPNPASGYFEINEGMSKVEIYSITGQLVKTYGKQLHGFQYSISDLKSGIYLVKVTDQNNREQTMKLVKQ